MTVYYKMQLILLQNVTAILLQNATEVYYKMRLEGILKNRCSWNSKTNHVPKHRSTFTISRSIHREVFLENSCH